MNQQQVYEFLNNNPQFEELKSLKVPDVVDNINLLVDVLNRQFNTFTEDGLETISHQAAINIININHYLAADAVEQAFTIVETDVLDVDAANTLNRMLDDVYDFNYDVSNEPIDFVGYEEALLAGDEFAEALVDLGPSQEIQNG